MLNPHIVWPRSTLRARLVLGVSSAMGAALDLAYRSALTQAVIAVVNGRVTSAALIGETHPLFVLWEQRTVEDLPYGCVSLTVPIVGGTPLSRRRLLAELEHSTRELGEHDSLEASLGTDGSMVLGMRSATVDGIPLARLIEEAAVRASGTTLVLATTLAG